MWQLTELFPSLHVYIVAINRGEDTLTPDAGEELRPGDDAYFLCDTAHLERAMSSFGREEKEARRVVVVGGASDCR